MDQFTVAWAEHQQRIHQINGTQPVQMNGEPAHIYNIRKG